MSYSGTPIPIRNAIVTLQNIHRLHNAILKDMVENYENEYPRVGSIVERFQCYVSFSFLSNVPYTFTLISVTLRFLTLTNHTKSTFSLLPNPTI